MAREELLARRAVARPMSAPLVVMPPIRQLPWAIYGGDAVMVNSTPAGGHISHNTIGVFGRRIQTRGLSLSLDAPKHIPLHYFRWPRICITWMCRRV